MSLVAIRNGLFGVLTACGPYAASQISTCSLALLDVAPACALTFFPDGTSTIEIATMAQSQSTIGQHYRKWAIGGTVWLNADGDPAQLFARLWQSHDDLYNTLVKDETLGGTALFGALKSITTHYGQFLKVGGHVWKAVDWVVEAEELN